MFDVFLPLFYFYRVFALQRNLFTFIIDKINDNSNQKLSIYMIYKIHVDIVLKTS